MWFENQWVFQTIVVWDWRRLLCCLWPFILYVHFKKFLLKITSHSILLYMFSLTNPSTLFENCYLLHYLCSEYEKWAQVRIARWMDWQNFHVNSALTSWLLEGDKLFYLFQLKSILEIKMKLGCLKTVQTVNTEVQSIYFEQIVAIWRS